MQQRTENENKDGGKRQKKPEEDEISASRDYKSSAKV